MSSKMSTEMLNGNASLNAEMVALVQENIRTGKYLEDLEKLYGSEMEKVEEEAKWTKEAQELALCKKKLKKIREHRDMVHANIGSFLKQSENGEVELLSPSDENIKMYARLSKKLEKDLDDFNNLKSSAGRVKKVEECIALITELKTYRNQLINQKDALKMIRQNEKIEETILELAIDVQVLKMKVNLVQSALKKQPNESKVNMKHRLIGPTKSEKIKE